MLAVALENSKIKNGIAAVKYKIPALLSKRNYLYTAFKYFSPLALKLKLKNIISPGRGGCVFDCKSGIKQKSSVMFFKKSVSSYRICI